MTEQQINEQIKAIKEVAKSLSSSKERTAAFLKSAGIPSTPLIKKPGKNTISGSSK